ncbi:MAG TPA: hypothetical protein VFI56_09050 [Vicinamibacterales bacterium]|nr:hypothetical protein [Vicinamibacterales bacterium]
MENLWMAGEFPVDGSTRKIFLAARSSEERDAGSVCPFSRRSSLVRRSHPRKIHGSVTPSVHRFEESIAGRDYLIEVANVAKDRWRAYIVRIPGVPTALMPFYGTTPAEAAHQLCEWLTRAHARAAKPSTTV